MGMAPAARAQETYGMAGNVVLNEINLHNR